MKPDRPTDPGIDPSDLIDAGAWSRYQRSLLAAVACALLFDGLDNQALSLALPLLVAEWGVRREDFALVMTIGLAGMAIGTAAGGMVGDRIGRKPALIASVLSFGVLTTMLAFTSSVGQIGLLKFLAGLGLGGAVPNAMAYISEITPTARRSLATILAAMCVGLGGLAGGIAAAWILPALGWQALFVAVGVPPILLGLLQWRWLPESPKYLAKRGHQGAAIRSFLLRSGHAVPEGCGFRTVMSGSPPGSLRSLFRNDIRRDTLALWSAYWLTLFSLYALASWLPAIFAQTGFDLSVASIALAAFNLGGIAGSLGAAWAIARLGSRTALVAMALLGAASTGAFVALPLSPDTGLAMPIVLVLLAGVSIAGLQVALYSVGIQVYDDANRATGLGWAVGFGRIGGIVSPLLASAVLATQGPGGLFAILTLAMCGCGAALALIRRHLPARMVASN